MWSDGGPAQPVAHDRAGDQWRLPVAGGQMLVGLATQGIDALEANALPPILIVSPSMTGRLSNQIT
jgi:hypothetical protein